MDFGGILLKDRSKEKIQEMANYLISHPEDLSEFIELLDPGNQSITQYRAAWVLGYLSPIGITVLEPHLDLLLKLLAQTNIHPTITRSITRLFQHLLLPESHQGKLIDICFNILTSENQLSAQRANCMTILHQYTKIYPELNPELELVIFEILAYKKDPALQSRGQKILKALRKKI